MVAIAKQSGYLNHHGVILDGFENSKNFGENNQSSLVLPDVLKKDKVKEDTLAKVEPKNVTPSSQKDTLFNIRDYDQVNVLRLFDQDKEAINPETQQLIKSLCRAIQHGFVSFPELNRLHPIIKNNGNIFLTCLHWDFIKTISIYFDSLAFNAVNHHKSPLVFLQQEISNIDYHKMATILTGRGNFPSNDVFIHYIQDLGSFLHSAELKTTIKHILFNIPLDDLVSIQARINEISYVNYLDPFFVYGHLFIYTLNKIIKRRLKREQVDTEGVNKKHKPPFFLSHESMFIKKATITPSLDLSFLFE